MVGRYLYSTKGHNYVSGTMLSDEIKGMDVMKMLSQVLSPKASAFLDRWQIPTINRQALQNLEQHYSAIPFHRVTDLLDTVFDSDLTSIIPIAVDEITLFEQFVKAAEDLDQATGSNIFLRVAPNVGKDVSDSASTLIWSLVIKQDQLTLPEMKNLAQKLQSKVEPYSCGHIIHLPVINEKMISVINKSTQSFSEQLSKTGLKN